MKPKAWNLAVFLICASAFSISTLAAQSYPSKPIRWIVPFPAGGTGDIVVRNLSGPMTKSLGQQMIADFRPGAFTIIGTELAARAPADGYTLLFVSNGFVTNRAVRSKLPYDTLKDFVGVARIVTTPFIMVVHPSVPAKSLKELLALARLRPGDLTIGTISMGGAMHIAREMLSQSAKVSFNPVHY